MAADPVLDYARPDVEALVWDTIKALARNKDITSWAYAANDPRTPAGWLSITSVQVDVRARYKQAAAAKADTVRRLLLGLPHQPWDGGVIARVNIVEGPFYLADVDGRPRYTLRCDVFAHPHRASKESTA